MKIYNKFDFLFSIVLAVTAPLAWRLTGGFSWTAMLFLGVLVIRGLYRSLSKEAYELSERARRRDLWIRQKRFGPLANIIPYGWLIFLAAAWMLAESVPYEGLNPPVWVRWTVGILLVLALGFLFWYSWIMRKWEIDEEEIPIEENGI